MDGYFGTDVAVGPRDKSPSRAAKSARCLSLHPKGERVGKGSMTGSVPDTKMVPNGAGSTEVSNWGSPAFGEACRQKCGILGNKRPIYRMYPIYEVPPSSVGTRVRAKNCELDI